MSDSKVAEEGKSSVDHVHEENESSDAPGWGKEQAELGPVCWSCKGAKQRKKKDKERKEVVMITCPACSGRGRILKRKKQFSNANKPGAVKKSMRKLPEGYVVPGPSIAGGVEPEQGEELCHLLGHWRIFQRVGGHRWSTDDLVTAYAAGQAWKRANPGSIAPQHCLDLGCGIGTVLMMVAWQFPSAKCLGVEAQRLSASMARRSIQYNGCADRCTVEQGDIRLFEKFDCVSPDGKYDLVTGTPPYFPVFFSEKDGTATTTVGGLPTCEQSAPARYEFRGGIEAYCQAAQPRLRNSSSRFLVCEGFLDTNHPRVLESAKNAGLRVLHQTKVLGRDDKPPLFAVYEMCLDVVDAPQHPMTEETLIVRHKGGKHSKDYLDLMSHMGIPPPVQPSSS